MTVETQASRVQYMGSGLTTEFPVPFPVLRPEHLKLFLWAEDRQVELTRGYAVLGAGTPAVTVVLDTPPAPGATLTILRRMPLVQPMDLSNSGPFNAETLEGSADNLAMQIQQLKEEIGRAIVAPESLNAGEVTYSTLAELLGAAEAAVGEAREARDQARAELCAVRHYAAQAAGAAAQAAAVAPEIMNALGDKLDKADLGPFASYSAEEKFTGQYWLDGKKIYAKTIECGALPNNAQKLVPFSIPNIYRIISVNGYCFSPNHPGGYTSMASLPLVNGVTGTNIGLGIEANQRLSLTTNSDRTYFTEVFVTLNYTCTDR